MVKKGIGLVLLIALVGASLTGCFGTGGYEQPEPTVPPQKDFKSIEELSEAVTAAKADSAAEDLENLKGLAGYYRLTTVPDGAAVSYVKVSSEALRIGYSFGPAGTDQLINQMELIWYRTAKLETYLEEKTKSIGAYDAVKAGGNSYLRTLPTFQFSVTADPASTDAATPTPRSGTYCQFLFWVQNNGTLLCAVPLDFTDEDIGKYCQAEYVELK